jgi:predicted RNA-binding Zn ribbon-like protein
MELQSGTHVHEAELETVLAFVNTDELEDGAPVDHLADDAAAIGWLASHGLLHPEHVPEVDARVHDRVEAVRAAVREVIEAVVADRTAQPAALRTVNRALARRDVLELVPAPDGARVSHRHVGDPVDAALARLIEPIVAIVSGGDVDRLRICANDRCRWAFYDTSRTGRRRWCDMATCGNRAKAARHRARAKAGPRSGEESGPKS